MYKSIVQGKNQLVCKGQIKELCLKFIFSYIDYIFLLYFRNLAYEISKKNII